MRIGIVGPGRLGRTLHRLLSDAGWAVTLAGRGSPIPAEHVILLTVPDSGIAEVARTVPRGRVVLHASGAYGIDILRPHTPAGSFHPLMTFPGPDLATPDLDGVPAAIDGDEEALAAATELAAALGMLAIRVPGDRRLYHAAAVMAGNFATVLLADAARVLAAAGVAQEEAASLLAPLALASLRNAAHDPERTLTGPAARGDTAVVEAHLAALREHGLEAQRLLYEAITARAAAIAGVAKAQHAEAPIIRNR